MAGQPKAGKALIRVGASMKAAARAGAPTASGPAAGRVHQPAGNPQESALKTLEHPRGCPRHADHLGEAGEIMSDRGKLGPSRVCGELPGGRVGERPGLQIADRKLDYGVAAMLCLDRPISSWRLVMNG